MATLIRFAAHRIRYFELDDRSRFVVGPASEVSKLQVHVLLAVLAACLHAGLEIGPCFPPVLGVVALVFDVPTSITAKPGTRHGSPLASRLGA